MKHELLVLAKGRFTPPTFGAENHAGIVASDQRKDSRGREATTKPRSCGSGGAEHSELSRKTLDSFLMEKSMKKGGFCPLCFFPHVGHNYPRAPKLPDSFSCPNYSGPFLLATKTTRAGPFLPVHKKPHFLIKQKLKYSGPAPLPVGLGSVLVSPGLGIILSFSAGTNCPFLGPFCVKMNP